MWGLKGHHNVKQNVQNNISNTPSTKHHQTATAIADKRDKSKVRQMYAFIENDNDISKSNIA